MPQQARVLVMFAWWMRLLAILNGSEATCGTAALGRRLIIFCLQSKRPVKEGVGSRDEAPTKKLQKAISNDSLSHTCSVFLTC